MVIIAMHAIINDMLYILKFENVFILLLEYWEMMFLDSQDFSKHYACIGKTKLLCFHHPFMPRFSHEFYSVVSSLDHHVVYQIFAAGVCCLATLIYQ